MPILPINHKFKFTNKTKTNLNLNCSNSNELISFLELNLTSKILETNYNKLNLSSSTSTSLLNNSENLNEKSSGISIEESNEFHEIIINPLSRNKKTKLLKTEKDNEKYWIFQTSSKEERIQHLIAYDARDVSNWMSTLPDTRNLATLYLPGSHETLALHGFPISTCQSTLSSVKKQLESGLRFFDFRFSLMKGKGEGGGELLGYHGVQNQYIKAIDAFNVVYDFLDSHKGETIIISVKQENFTPGFEEKLWELINTREEFWFKEDRFPNLGEVRGKVLLFCRFSNRLNVGLHPMRWPNNNSKVWDTTVGGIHLLVQDWYSIGSFTQIPEKAALVYSLFNSPSPLPLTSSPPSPSTSNSIQTQTQKEEPLPLRINFLSGATFLTAFPFVVAKGFFWGLGIKGVNERVLASLLSLSTASSTSTPTLTPTDNTTSTPTLNTSTTTSTLDTSTSNSTTANEEEEENKRIGGEQKRELDGGMILLQDYFEVPGGLTELMIAWNF